MLSMKKLLYLTLILFSQQVFAQNVKISDKNTPQEPSIMLDPNNPAVIIAGANNENYYISEDTGRTWTSHILTSNYGVWGDPCISVDTAGHFYFFHLSNPPGGNWIDRIVCQKTEDKGKTWNDGTYTGLNGAKAQDKQWCAIDRKNNNMYLTWTQFDRYGSTNLKDSSIILFSKSTDAGNTWSQPLRINKAAGDCIDDDKTVEGATPAIGPNGEIYVSWAGPNGLVFNRSKDEGKTWLPNEIKIDSMPGGWNYAIPGLIRANGLPVTACDTSKGLFRGTIYVNWSDQRNGENNTDIWLAKSTDGGNTWSAPIKVNDDFGNKHQFLTWMSIDQTTGYLYFVFYDRRNYSDNNTDVFVAVSKDGGKTFINHKISETPFKPSASVFFGDYTNIVAHNGIIRPIWARLAGSQLSVWTDLTTLDAITTGVADVSVKEENTLDFENYPNPSTQAAYVSFKLHETSTVNLSIYNLQGKLLGKVIQNQKRSTGKYIEKIDFEKMHISAGTYFMRLDVNGKTKTLKMIVVE
jgi:hypothetical protein